MAHVPTKARYYKHAGGRGAALSQGKSGCALTEIILSAVVSLSKMQNLHQISRYLVDCVPDCLQRSAPAGKIAFTKHFCGAKIISSSACVVNMVAPKRKEQIHDWLGMRVKTMKGKTENFQISSIISQQSRFWDLNVNNTGLIVFLSPLSFIQLLHYIVTLLHNGPLLFLWRLFRWEPLGVSAARVPAGSRWLFYSIYEWQGQIGDEWPENKISHLNSFIHPGMRFTPYIWEYIRIVIKSMFVCVCVNCSIRSNRV